MKPIINETYLITTDRWFLAPDGNQYKAVFGTVKGISSDGDILGVKTNRASTNWYVAIGNMIIAGCQIHYCIKSKQFDSTQSKREVEHNGKIVISSENITRIYDADEA